MERLAEELLLFHTGLGTLYEVNEVGKSIWHLCNGQNSIEEIETEIADKYGTKTSVREETEHFLEMLIDHGLITLQPSKGTGKNHSICAVPCPTNHSPKQSKSSPTTIKSKVLYKTPKLREVWSERSAISSLFLVEV